MDALYTAISLFITSSSGSRANMPGSKSFWDNERVLTKPMAQLPARSVLKSDMWGCPVTGSGPTVNLAHSAVSDEATVRTNFGVPGPLLPMTT